MVQNLIDDPQAAQIKPMISLSLLMPCFSYSCAIISFWSVFIEDL